MTTESTTPGAPTLEAAALENTSASFDASAGLIDSDALESDDIGGKGSRNRLMVRVGFRAASARSSPCACGTLEITNTISAGKSRGLQAPIRA